MTARKPFYNAEEALQSIWNDSGDEEDILDSDESEAESYASPNEDQNDDSHHGSSSNEGNVEDSSGGSDSEPSDSGNGGVPANRVRQRRAGQQTAALVWRMARGTVPLDIAFTGNPGIHVQTAGFQPHEYFSLFITDDLLNCFVPETNRYANQFIAEGNLRRSSRANDCFPTNREEMKKFLGLLFLMGIVHKPAIHMYWSKDPLFCTPIFSAVMSRNRFQLLLKFLHFNDNSNMPAADDPSPDKLFKLRPLLDHLFEKFQQVYVPFHNISIDESLLLWKGKLGFKQYIPLKRARFGVKSFMLCEDSGYTFSFKIYCGKENVAPAAQELSVSERVVIGLCNHCFRKGTIYILITGTQVCHSTSTLIVMGL